MSRGVIIAPAVRVWDENMDLRGQLLVDVTETAEGHRSTTLPLDDEIAAWLLADSRRGAYLTIEMPGEGRGTVYRLHHYKVDRVGTCPECAHCMQKQLTAVWIA